MKKFFMKIAMISTMISATAVAGVADVPPTDELISPALIEKVVILKQETKLSPIVIKLVQYSTGGSSDITSAIWPSKLVLAFYIKGEMWDTSATYEVGHLVDELKVEKFTGDILKVSYKAKNDRMQVTKNTATLFIAPVIKAIQAEADEGKNEGKIYEPVGLKMVVL
jgi:hypothetical protein